MMSIIPGIKLTFCFLLSLFTLNQASRTDQAKCITNGGKAGVCHIPSHCVGVSLQEIESNLCEIGRDIIGACCADVTVNNIKVIQDGEIDDIELPDITNNQIENIFSTASNTQSLFETDAETATVDSGEPAAFHNKFNAASAAAKKIDKYAKYFLDLTKQLQRGLNLTSKQAGIGLRTSFNLRTNNNIEQNCPWTPVPVCNAEDKYRSIDGTCNNLENPNYGRSNTPFQRYILPEYEENSIDLPRTKSGNFSLPSARDISNRLAKGSNEPDMENTILLMQMGQFIDHDITHTPAANRKCCGDQLNKTPDCFPIQIKQNDPFWKGSKTCMEFTRSLGAPGLDCELKYREQLNQITHWLDGSNIYGSILEEADELRSKVGGKLKISDQKDSFHGYLPSCKGMEKGKVHGCDLCQDNNNAGNKKDQCYFAGDLRVNEQLNLIVMHTVFMREHNRVAESLADINPCWKDDILFEETRRIVIAEYQHIVYKEWLPIVLGNSFMKRWGMLTLNSGHSFDYADDFDPRINNEFATAAFRFGHSLIPNDFKIENNKRTARNPQSMNLKEMFFKPEKMKRSGMLDSLMHGMMGQNGQAADSSFSEDLRNHLFESNKGAGGLDLVALNIQRGRDHGLPGYTKYRELCGMGVATQWSDLYEEIDPMTVVKLRKVYRSVEDVDLFVGGFLEKPHADSMVGPVFKCLLGDQFLRLKKGDRFFYDLGNDANIGFTTDQLAEIRKTSLAKIVCQNMDDMARIQPFIFKIQNSEANAHTSCDNIPFVNLETFKEFCPNKNSVQESPKITLEIITESPTAIKSLVPESQIVESCITEDGADVGKQCVFPFKYKDVLHESCTAVGDDEDKAWCSTKTDQEGDHIWGPNWGYCPQHCT